MEGIEEGKTKGSFNSVQPLPANIESKTEGSLIVLRPILVSGESKEEKKKVGRIS